MTGINHQGHKKAVQRIKGAQQHRDQDEILPAKTSALVKNGYQGEKPLLQI